MTEFTTWRSLVDGAEISDIPDSENLYAHYDAQQIDETDGTTITQWNDISDNGLDATDGTQATYRDSGINGEAAVDFNGSDDRLTVPDSTDDFILLHDGSPVSIYVVAEVESSDGFEAIFDTGAGSSQDVGCLFAAPDADDYNMRTNNGDGSSTPIRLVGGTPADDDLIELHFDEDAETEAELIVEESQVDTDTITDPTANDSTHNFTIGAEDGGERELDALIGEIMIYQSSHDSSTRSDVRDYLNTRWNRS